MLARFRPFRAISADARRVGRVIPRWCHLALSVGTIAVVLSGCHAAGLGSTIFPAPSGFDSLAIAPDGKNVYATSFQADSVVVFARSAQNGTLQQLPSRAGCIARHGSQGCTAGRGLFAATHVAISPDAKTVYVVSTRYSHRRPKRAGSIAVFNRDPATGALTQLAGHAGCLSVTAGEGCGHLRGLRSEATWIAVSPDGKSVYAVSGNHADGSKSPCSVGRNGKQKCHKCPPHKGLRRCLPKFTRTVPVHGAGAIAVFARDQRTGALRQLAGRKGCVNTDGADGCAPAHGLKQAVSVSISPDGRSVYTGTTGWTLADGIAVFSRKPSTGALTQSPGATGCLNSNGSAGCTSTHVVIAGAHGIAFDPYGRHAYVSALGVFVTFKRDPYTGILQELKGSARCLASQILVFTGHSEGCRAGRGAVLGPADDVATRDGRSVYAIDQGILGTEGIDALAPDPSSGMLSQLSGEAGCIEEFPIEGQGCGTARVLNRVMSLAASGDGRNVYSAAIWSNAIGVYARDPSTGKLLQLSGQAGCIAGTGGSYPSDGASCAHARGDHI
jgi:DNA-binding beta-propeller fold protein YncE